MVGAGGEIHNIYSTKVRYDRRPKFHKPMSTLKWTPRKVRSNSGLVSTIQFQVNHLVSPLKPRLAPKCAKQKSGRQVTSYRPRHSTTELQQDTIFQRTMSTCNQGFNG